ncbi:hypothetical protein DPMN_046120 [Dreissena polymorpha]|uniref:Uncharacterized protein n=1 Tax=Dreissena polymorpha TaxID=45954 RepID=A0A9D4D5L6_DREPO|nr:hypothetical protein DPMN_046120 [Dreissena polymorpha]
MALVRNVDIPNVAEDPRAKLMYYFKCITDVLQFTSDNPFIERIKIYQAYIDVLGPMLEALRQMVVLLSPDKFLSKCVFVDTEFCTTGGGCPIILTKTTAIPSQFAALDGVQVDGNIYVVQKVMIVTPEWLRDFYIVPLIIIEEMIKIEQQEQRQRQKSCTCTLL